MTYKVVFINPLSDYIDGLKEAIPDGFELEVLPAGTEMNGLIEGVREADFIVSGIEIPEEVFRSARNIKFIQYMSSGYGQLPLDVLNDLGVPVAQMKTHSISVAEHAVLLMLAVLRRLPASMDLMRAGEWRPDLDETSYSELYGKTVGIVGLGNIGRWIGKAVSHGFGADVIFYDEAEIPLTVSELIPARAVSLEELLEKSDIVSLSLPLNERSEKLIGTAQFALMKSSAVIINVSRGELLDERALVEALQDKRIAGAGLDVFDAEPLNLDSDLLNLDQVVCTPHMAGVGWENVQRRIQTVWQNIDAVVRGRAPSGVITEVKC